MSKTIESTFNVEVKSLCGWLEENKLSNHLGKIEDLFFASKIRLVKADSMHISCNGVNIETALMVNYQGNSVDQDMNGSSKGKYIVHRSMQN